MSKPRITAAAVIAAYEVLEQYPVPENYYKVSSDEQRQMRLTVVQQALIAAYTATHSDDGRAALSPENGGENHG